MPELFGLHGARAFQSEASRAQRGDRVDDLGFRVYRGLGFRVLGF